MSESQLDLRISPPGDRVGQSDLARQLSDTQLAIVLESITDGVTVQDLTGQLIYGNDVAAQLIGYPDAQTLLTVPVEDIVTQFEIFDESGQPVTAEYLPGRLALQGLESPTQ